MTDNTIERLSAVNFQLLGQWCMEVDHLRYELTSEDDETRMRLSSGAALYAFVSEGNVFYVGKTALSLKQRFVGYCKPGTDQRTNLKCHRNIKAELAAGKTVEIHTLTGVTPLCWGEFELDVAAGLENSLIKQLDPPWNGKCGKQTVSESAELESEALNIPREEIQPPAPETPHGITFTIKLHKSYYDKGFINPPKDVAEHLGAHGESLTFYLGRDRPDKVEASINRHAVSNGTPRLFGRKQLAAWFQKNFALGDMVHAVIISKNEIVLEESKR